MPNKVDVVIGGEIFTLVSGENDEYIQRLAKYINAKFNEILTSKSHANINPQMRSLLIAINIADDLFKERDKLLELQSGSDIAEGLLAELDALRERYDELSEYNRQLAEELKTLNEERSELIEKNAALQRDLEDSQNELTEYINTFDERTGAGEVIEYGTIKQFKSS